MTCLCSAQRKTLVLNLCVAKVVNGCFRAQREHSSFICGVNLKQEANVSVGNRNTTPKCPLVWFGDFIFLLQRQGNVSLLWWSGAPSASLLSIWQWASLKHLPLIVPFGPVPGIAQTFLLHPLLDYCCGTLIFISNYNYKVCGWVGVPLDNNTGDICVPTMYGLGAALLVVVAGRKAIMAFNWDVFVRVVEQTHWLQNRWYLSACLHLSCK